MAPNFSKFQSVGVALALLCASEEKIKKRRIWMKRWLKERNTLSHVNIMNLLESDDLDNFLRMDSETFHELLEMVRPLISKQDTNMRQAVTAEERLIATIRFLATGREYKDLRYSTIISHQLLAKIIPETCWAIYEVLKKTIKLPSTEDEWRTTATLFEEQWHFNNCVGCMDGKHIRIEKPPETGSLFFNYKGTFSVVLFAVVNANYEFMYVHTGSNGSMSDGGILKNTRFYEKLGNGELGLPESYLLPGTDVSVPFVFLGDSAFALDKNVMKPFPERGVSKEERIFNYRLSRARRIVENTFGILASRFRVFKGSLNLKLENIDAIVLASCALHNFLRKKSETYLTPKSVDSEDITNVTVTPGEWRENTEPLTPLERSIQRPSNEGRRVRNILTEYFNNAGRVSFQDRMVHGASNSESVSQ